MNNRRALAAERVKSKNEGVQVSALFPVNGQLLSLS
jgi:hypothetical protein